MECGITILKQPMHYDWKNWIVLIDIVATATLSFVYDDDLYDFFDGMFDVHQANTISQYTDLSGEELFIIPCIAGTYLMSTISKNCRLRNVSLATLACKYNDKIWFVTLVYSLARIISFGRLISKEHWTSNVLIGVALGYFIGCDIVVFQKKINNIKDVKLEPVVT